MVGVAVRGTDQNLVAVGNRDLLEALDQLREEGVGNVLDDDAEQAAAAGDQGARVGIGEVVQLPDGLPNALGKPFADGGGTIDGSGDSGDGYLGQGGDGTDVGRLGDYFARSFSSHGPILNADKKV